MGEKDPRKNASGCWDLTAYYIERKIKINFCPMCGRKLTA